MDQRELLIHPALEKAAIAASKVLRYDGRLDLDNDRNTYSAAREGMILDLRLRQEGLTPIIDEARHWGAPTEVARGVLDTFCHVIAELPLQEAADHGTIHTLHQLCDNLVARPVSGILTPRSAGAIFAQCDHLIRTIFNKYMLDTGVERTKNFWNRPLSPSWRKASKAKQIKMLQTFIEKFREVHNVDGNAISIVTIEKSRRVMVELGPSVEYRDKPALLMRLEIYIRQASGERLELFMTEAKDSNVIRRLAPEEQIQ